MVKCAPGKGLSFQRRVIRSQRPRTSALLTSSSSVHRNPALLSERPQERQAACHPLAKARDSGCPSCAAVSSACAEYVSQEPRRLNWKAFPLISQSLLRNSKARLPLQPSQGRHSLISHSANICGTSAVCQDTTPSHSILSGLIGAVRH